MYFGETRDEDKARYHDYRDKAREIYALNDQNRQVDVPKDAVVQMTETGAFVEALVWVPLSDIRDKK